MTYPYLPYAITEAYCAVFAVTVWFRLNSNIGSEYEVRQLRNMIIAYLTMIVTDIVWAFMEDGLIRLPHLLNAFDNAVSVTAIVFGCYFWFRFIEARLHFGRKSLYVPLTIPLLATCVLDFVSVFTGWLFYIDAQGHYQDTPLFLIHTAVNYFYLMIPTIYSVVLSIRSRSRQERAEYRTYALYMVAPLLSGLLEDAFPGVPLLALNIFLMILILFLMIQNMQVYNDALTGLNNRRRLNRYLEECLPKASAERPVMLFIMDINSFKAINDACGHLTGDNALKAFADALKDVAARYSAFAARYGGDEFCLVTDAPGHTPAEIAEEIHRSVRDARWAGDGTPPLTVSIGHAVCGGPGLSPDEALARADRLLYENKKAWHAARP